MKYITLFILSILVLTGLSKHTIKVKTDTNKKDQGLFDHDKYCIEHCELNYDNNVNGCVVKSNANDICELHINT
jgi:hypothetical protein